MGKPGEGTASAIDLSGRKAVVTGGGRGFGQTVATALTRAGADVLIVARDAVALEQTAAALRAIAQPAQHIETRQVDLADPAMAEVVFGGRWAACDILVNNAAIQGPIGPLWTNEPAAWLDAMTIDLLAPVALMRHVVPGMMARGRGRIINVSGGGATGPRAGFSAYAAAKTALVRVTETLAEELAGSGVTVNAIAPGAMNTAMTQLIQSAGSAAAGEKEVEIARRLAATDAPPGERAAELCVFLASDQSSRITGKLIAALWDPWPDFPGLADDIAGSDVFTLRRIQPGERGFTWGDAR